MFPPDGEVYLFGKYWYRWRGTRGEVFACRVENPWNIVTLGNKGPSIIDRYRYIGRHRGKFHHPSTAHEFIDPRLVTAAAMRILQRQADVPPWVWRSTVE